MANLVQLGNSQAPLWVDPNEVAVVGEYLTGSILILKTSGLKVKVPMHNPNEVAFIFSDVYVPEATNE